MANFEELLRPPREFNLRLTGDEIWALWFAVRERQGVDHTDAFESVYNILDELTDILDNTFE